MRITGVALVTGLALLAGFAAVSGAEAADELEVLVRLAGAWRETGGESEGLALVPDPLVILRDQKVTTTWSVDVAAHRPGSRVEISFENGTPFAAATGNVPADGTLSLGQLRDPVDLGRFQYVIRLFDAEGNLVARGRGEIEIREEARIPRKAFLIVGAVLLLFLVSNYVERESLTRSYEPEHHA
jgi:hypothetical protein